MPSFNLRSFSVYNDINHQKMVFDPSEISYLFSIKSDYDKNEHFNLEEFHNFLKKISSNFPDVNFHVYYSCNLYCAHCCNNGSKDEHNDVPCIYSNQLKICNSVITDRLIG